MRYFFLIVALSALWAPVSRADWYPPLKDKLPLPALEVLRDDGKVAKLQEVIATTGKGPALLLPVFTKCRMTCPIMVQALKRALSDYKGVKSGIDFRRVAILSFDASDTAKDLSDFRRRENIPSEWALVAARDQQAVRDFFDQYSYAIMSDDGGFNHPSQVLTLSSSLLWVGSVFGPEITRKDLSTAYDVAVDAESTHLATRIMNTLSHPETWVILGAVGLLLSLGAVFFRSLKAGHRVASSPSGRSPSEDLS